MSTLEGRGVRSQSEARRPVCSPRTACRASPFSPARPNAAPVPRVSACLAPLVVAVQDDEHHGDESDGDDEEQDQLGWHGAALLHGRCPSARVRTPRSVPRSVDPPMLNHGRARMVCQYPAAPLSVPPLSGVAGCYAVRTLRRKGRRQRTRRSALAPLFPCRRCDTSIGPHDGRRSAEGHKRSHKPMAERRADSGSH